ncbi:uncharacterized protein ARB_06124 [Trichophyton benhamiae CBS 112371]|uniref:Uncharacterized protein n=1 Tax=Arthroderma benhamiae (strain ATCC MYA-4681 / CBS 112371) TaxID=663331 RepID=D4APF6_ARTBC|nr:uncharacterized protein ARB_06124 [Trichophyton benhamiae CBS 112371]EFE35167.1 hypothetical protein ARB_06124 [Trichophyton benhamiae CBS 112371]
MLASLLFLCLFVCSSIFFAFLGQLVSCLFVVMAKRYLDEELPVFRVEFLHGEPLDTAADGIFKQQQQKKSKRERWSKEEQTVICYVTGGRALSVAKGNKVVLSSSKGTRRKKKMADQLVVFMCRFCGWSPGPPERAEDDSQAPSDGDSSSQEEQTPWRWLIADG